MAKFAESPDIFEEILKLIEYIPVDTTIPSNARFSQGVTLDSRFHTESTNTLLYTFPKLSINKNSISFRDIIKIFNIYFKSGCKMNMMFQRYNQLNQIGCTYPVEYLLFDYSLAALEDDYLDARLFLSHSFHVLGLRSSFNVILSVIINDSLTKDKDMREFLTRLAREIEPRNACTYMDAYGYEYKKRYQIYLRQLQELNFDD